MPAKTKRETRKQAKARYAEENRRAAKRALALVSKVNRGDDIETNITDLLANIRHLCDLLELDYAELDYGAYHHYTAEVVQARTGAEQ